ncbi:undecaprenyl-diphosphate phosphatase [Candidatus Saccharibacteria bacterium]|nr:undecaprenyl-diphosphate phosphatase [Candidatus Saccharibacteria bacterium]
MILIVVILAILQGITEFLPISSSAHLFLLPWAVNVPDPGLAFDAAIHIGTALALVAFFWKDFYALAKKRDKLLLYILIASVPAALAGYLGDQFIDKYFHQSSSAPLIIGIGLIFYGIVMYTIDKTAKLSKDMSHIGPKNALIIGFTQVLALVPGTSRSGITISAGELLGLNRESAARFSFLLATPISLGAGLYKLNQIVTAPQGNVSIMLTILGIVIAFGVGLAVITWILGYLKKHTLLIFVLYRFVLGFSVIAIWFIRR